MSPWHILVMNWCIILLCSLILKYYSWGKTDCFFDRNSWRVQLWPLKLKKPTMNIYWLLLILHCLQKQTSKLLWSLITIMNLYSSHSFPSLKSMLWFKFLSGISKKPGLLARRWFVLFHIGPCSNECYFKRDW